MSNIALVRRVEILEAKVDRLVDLPDRVAALELQIVQFRAEVRGEFAAIRREFAGEFAAIRGEFAGEFAAIRQEMATKADLEQLRAEMREGDEDTRRFMRVLHEEVLSRIALLPEGRAARPRSSGRRRKH